MGGFSIITNFASVDTELWVHTRAHLRIELYNTNNMSTNAKLPLQLFLS